MRITMRDGRVFDGSPVEIVEQMQQLAFGWDDRPVLEYVDWVVGQLARFEGVEVHVAGGSVEAVCAALVEEMVRVGVAVG